MAPGDTTQGRRVEFSGFSRNAQPGDYCKVPLDPDLKSHGYFHAADPTGGIGAITDHQVVEHEDGSISCWPSLVMPSGWHGYLECGIWREV